MINQVILIGRLGKAPEIRQTASGKDVASMTVATWHTKFNEQTQQFEQLTEWHNVCAWGSQVKGRISKLDKGDMVAVSGELRTRSYDDAQGVKKYITEIVGDVRAIGPKKEGDLPF